MKIVHTSDWHAGRLWKGRYRHDELRAALDSLARFVERERVDLVLVTGDVFDHGAPPAEAEALVFQFFRRLGKCGAQTVVIAGNHDNPARMEAWGTLTELVNVRTVARPRHPDSGGVIELEIGGERATIGALPFAGLADMIEAAQLTGDETMLRSTYADTLRRMIALLAVRFRPRTVNLLLAHTHLEGAVLARSERTVHVGEQWAALPQALPDSAHYVALGHIHRPQRIEAAPVLAHYAGSPMQLDFGEVGDTKSFVFLDARAGQPPRLELVPYEGTRRLRDVRGTLVELEHDAESMRDAWLRVTVPLEKADPEVAARVRALLPDAVDVRVELPRQEPIATDVQHPAATPRDVYAGYVRELGAEPEAELLDRFEALRLECEAAGDV